MTERVVRRVLRILQEQPHTVVYFTDAISPESFHHSLRVGSAMLFLHPEHEPLVDEIRRLA